MTSRYDCSLVIPSYNGASKLEKLIPVLATFTDVSFETIIVLDGSTDGSNDLVSKFLHLFPAGGLKVISTENQGRAKTRNTGAAHATTELILFLDDDMLPQSNFFTSHIEFHKIYPESIATGVQKESFIEMKTDFQRYKCYLSEKWNRVWNTELPSKMNKDTLHVTAANLSIPKKLFVQLNGFDGSLRDIEDYELGLRALSQGISLFYLPTALAFHQDFISCKSYLKRQLEYKSEGQKVRNKHQLATAAPLSPIKKYFYWLFSFPFWVKAIDNESQWLMALPQKMRYKIYDWVLWSQSQYFPPKA